jgi:hypothetical protein
MLKQVAYVKPLVCKGLSVCGKSGTSMWSEGNTYEILVRTLEGTDHLKHVSAVHGRTIVIDASVI